uniref:Gelsolin-like domain-containing protein n=1 Tax=Heterorhabditis bacteriophora TaxID=37862 RepID=A0A1I7X378_HETBA
MLYSSLDGDDVMILDALNLIYVWVGSGANPNEKKGAENTAKKYLEQGNLPRHAKTTIETIFQGQETPTFKKFFPKWDDKLFKNDIRSVHNMRKLLFNKNCIFDTVFSMTSSKGRMLLKHAHQYVLYSVKMFSSTVLADIGFSVLKLANLMSMTDNDLGLQKRRKLVL